MKTAIIAVAFMSALLAQSDKPLFEEASIHSSGPDPGSSMIQPLPGGGVRTEGMALRALITWAYQVQNYQLSGGPPWVENEGWNILATAAGPADAKAPLQYNEMTDAQRQRMLEAVRLRMQSLLADRFHLELRREQKEQTVYALVAGKGGLKLRESADQAQAGTLLRRDGMLECRGCLLDAAVQYLAVDLGRPVVNRTGLGAHYDFKLEWTVEKAGAETGGLSVFAAIQEQLGLKLESAKAPVEMLVIESAMKPQN